MSLENSRLESLCTVSHFSTSTCLHERVVIRPKDDTPREWQFYRHLADISSLYMSRLEVGQNMNVSAVQALNRSLFSPVWRSRALGKS